MSRLESATLFAAPLFLLFAAACTEPPPGAEVVFLPEPTPHEAEQLSLFQGGLDTTELGAQWLAEAERALREPVRLEAPYAELGHFVRPEASALGYRIELVRGQRLEIGVDGELATSDRLLVDLFRADPSGESRPARIRSLRPGDGSIVLEPRRDGEYILRLQPALFADGPYRLEVQAGPALAFPVVDHDHEAVWSGFGAPREGGQREHHGVDIFAPRGTPVIAAADGVVRRADVTPVGGKVVWLRDARRPRSLYYAHLDSQLVRRGQRVQVGDTLGLVGNTGNAVTTPPHLHFGLYVRGEGPIDPFPFIRKLPSRIPTITVDLGMTGTWARARSEGVRLRSAPSTRSDVLGELARDQAFRVVAATGDWYRVRLSDGSQGYVAGRLAEATGAGRFAAAPPPLTTEPAPERAVTATGSPGVGSGSDASSAGSAPASRR